MEGNHRQPPTGIQQGHGLFHNPLHTAQLVVDRNADGLKAAFCRMLLFPQGGSGHGRTDDIHQLQGGFDFLFLPALTDGGGNPGSEAFLAIIV